MVAHETQGFIQVRDVVRINSYSSGATALVFVCLITGVVAPSYVVDWNRWNLDLEPEIPTLLYIGRG
jgi:hypothetical protein